MEQYYNDPFAAAAAADDAASQRSGSRDSLLLGAQLRFAGGTETVPVRVRNLSSGGLMAEYAEPVARQTPVEVDVRGVGWVRGQVAWSAEGRIGIAFDREIDPKLARKPVGKGTTTPTYVKPILPRRG
ncbi:PilZ domain-containing protein [Stakelama tenebrarum]|uniref:PilZ domain-containing protein n=1 Tax=Stakelama tenebrarum TaxID=2711215 RepID=A0A6G6Y659_9SPHN|nr:PilZ domain-containing protein [Sphingosinithalassobacter tenebrarum]QIG80400.1 PilZ domain-containing protein [Sphingosinithalassobacter tenebrarum]